MNQSEMILNHLRSRGSISPVEAQELYGCMRLGARIWDLKRQGYVIVAEREEGVNRRGEKCHWARYSLRRSRSEGASAAKQDAPETRGLFVPEGPIRGEADRRGAGYRMGVRA